MTTARRVTISLYAMAYMAALYVGVTAADDGHHLYAYTLFGVSMALLVAIYREYRNTALLIHLVGVYRHNQRPDYDEDAAAIEYATAFPPGCRCETWWISMGADHDTTCPAYAREESP